MYRKKTILAFLFTIAIVEAYSQTARISETPRLKSQIDSIKVFRLKKDKVVTDTIFDKKLDSVLNTVSGVSYTQGKATRTSAAVDDKGLTLNYDFDEGYYHTWLVTASATSKDGLVDLVKSGKYSKTLTAGVSYFWFPTNFNGSTPDPSGMPKLHKQIDQINNYFEAKRNSTIGKDELQLLKTTFETYRPYIYDTVKFKDKDIYEFDSKSAELKSLLKKYAPYLQDNFDTLSFEDQKKAINQLLDNSNAVLDHYFYTLQLDSLNAVQLAYQFKSTRLFWLQFGGKYNYAAYPVFDATAVKTDYVRTLDDHYASIAVTANFTWLSKSVNQLISPTIKFQHNRDYTSEDLLSLNIPQNIRTVGNESISDYKQVSYYNNEINQKINVAIEVPYTLYFPKAKMPFGIDFAVNTKTTDLQNLGGRLGVYLTLPGKEENIIIEPLLRVTPWQAGSKSFGQDQLSLGINLTVAVPSFLTGKKK